MAPILLCYWVVPNAPSACRPSGVFVIAEAGVNHGGDPALAERLVEAAAEAGADAVKFQTFAAERLVTGQAEKAPYQCATTGPGGQLDMLRALELPPECHAHLRSRAHGLGLEFLSTPFDIASLDFLISQVGVPRIKLGSGEITHGALLLAAACTDRPIILSTGMSTLEEVADALAVISYGVVQGGPPPSLGACRELAATPEARSALARRVTLLHCTSQYPAPLDDVHLRAMGTLRERFGLPVGYSDHTEGIATPTAAVALGACMVEKHFTLCRALPGPDHRASLEPADFAAMVSAVRATERALGTAAKMLTRGEQPVQSVARRSLVAARPIRRGETLAPDAMIAKRPAGGCSPLRIWDLCGRPASRDYEPDEPIAEQVALQRVAGGGVG